MYINDDADAAAIVQTTVGALKECSRHIGKVGVSFNSNQISEMEDAIRQLIARINLKKEL